MKEPVDFELLRGESLAIVGDNASGKTMFVDILMNRHPLIGQGVQYDFSPSDSTLISDNIKYISFKDCYGESDGTYYLQQRWNQHDIDEETPKVGSLLDEAYLLTGKKSEKLDLWRKRLYELFEVGHLLEKYIILLSSGELRKYQLIRALLVAPKVLVIDNPFIGLDKETREQLKDLLEMLFKEGTVQIILVTPQKEDIPSFITHVVEVKDMKVCPKVTKEEFLLRDESKKKSYLDEEKRNAILSLPDSSEKDKTLEIVKMTNVRVRYGERSIIKDLSWTIKNGERWALSGQNGSGKSTLLSLICADNPQAYACDIELFGYKRGTGESIWDIKKHIGYVSPEMHRACHHDLKSLIVVASGLNDSTGLYRHPDEEEIKRCLFWMRIFGIEDLYDRSFLKLSDGEQRLVLLARAFVKDPKLLVLDEPFHGLDLKNRLMATEVIETFCKRKDKTLIIVSHYLEEVPSCVDKELKLVRTI